MRDYMTRDGDMVDLIAFETYGTEDAREAIYEANPGLADLSLTLPAGVTITLPEWSAPQPSVPQSGFNR